MTDAIVVQTEEQKDAVIEAIAEQVTENLTEELAAVVEDAADEDGTEWLEKRLDDSERFNREWREEMKEQNRMQSETITRLLEVVTRMSEAAAVSALAKSSEPIPNPVITSIPEVSEPVAPIVEPVTVPEENAGVLPEAKIEARKHKRRRI